MKIKVLEVEATKLDPKAAYIIVFNKMQLSRNYMQHVIDGLTRMGIEAVYTLAPNPADALKVYQIPKPLKSRKGK